VIAFAALAVLLCVSLWWSVPAAVRRSEREDELRSTGGDAGATRDAAARARGAAAEFSERALAWGDELSRIAFLYGVAPSRWPRALDPGLGLLAAAEAERLADGLRAYLGGLERGRAELEACEARDPGLARRTPSIAPIVGTCEPAGFFGPRVSPWTGEEEFFCGLDLAAPEGSVVVAPADGRVVYAGRPRREVAPRLWQFGNVVVVAHGPEWATVYGHLSRAFVRRGDWIRRGQRIGSVGRSGWALSPRLHYEVWRPQGGLWHPTDPLFTILDRRFDSGHRTLAEMLATSAPEPTGELPGLR